MTNRNTTSAPVFTILPQSADYRMVQVGDLFAVERKSGLHTRTKAYTFERAERILLAAKEQDSASAVDASLRAMAAR